MYGRFGGPRVLRPELKYLDTAIIITPTNVLTVGGDICTIQQGPAATQRIGRKCKLESIQLNVLWNMATNNTNAEDDAHFWLVQDTQCNGTQATASEVFDGSITSVPGQHMRLLENSSRFKILMHQQMDLNSPGPSPGAPTFYAPVQEQRTYFKKLNIPMIWSATSTLGTIATRRSNSLFVIFGSVYGMTQLQFVCRLRFRDP
jgi:hypothetical protein